MPDIWESYGFECRLRSGDADVDLGIGVSGEGFARLARSAADDEIGAPGPAGDAWARLRRFASRWCEGGSTLRAWCPFMFLEFDADTADHDGMPIPSVFVALDSPLRSDAGRPHHAAALECAELLQGRRLETALGGKLEACIGALPDDGFALHVGAMLGRSEPGLRMSVSLPGAAVRGYLARLDAHEATRSAAVTLDALPDWLVQTQLDFDFAARVAPRVGFGIRPAQRGGRTWSKLLIDLEQLGLCDSEKAAALLSWPAASPRLRIGGVERPFDRQLSHVKIVSVAGRALEAKAYFSARPSEAEGAA